MRHPENQSYHHWCICVHELETARQVAEIHFSSEQNEEIGAISGARLAGMAGGIVLTGEQLKRLAELHVFGFDTEMFRYVLEGSLRQ